MAALAFLFSTVALVASLCAILAVVALVRRKEEVPTDPFSQISTFDTSDPVPDLQLVNARTGAVEPLNAGGTLVGVFTPNCDACTEAFPSFTTQTGGQRKAAVIDVTSDDDAVFDLTEADIPIYYAQYQGQASK